MKLTKEEKFEKCDLHGMIYSSMFMTQKQQDRLSYLNAKEIHKSCLNKRCIDYDGLEFEILRLNCVYVLANTI